MATFTASEVVKKLRERFASGNDVPVPDVRLTRAEFDVIADMLEAREKAVPVATVRQALTGGYWIDWHGKQMPDYLGCDLYIHPAPSDTERLAEALRAKIRRLRNMPKGEFQLAASIFADDLERIFDAHCLQLQLPAAVDAAMAKESGR